MIARGVETTCRRQGRRRFGTDAVDASSSALGPLAVGPIGHKEGAVRVHNYVRWSEAVGIIGGAGREFDLLHRGEAGAFPFASVYDNRPPPFTKEERALIRGGEGSFEVGNTTRG